MVKTGNSNIMGDIIKHFGTNLKVSGVLRSIPLEWFSPVKPTYSAKLLRPIIDKTYTKALQRKSCITTATLFLILCQGIYDSKYNTVADTVEFLLLMILLITGNVYHYLSQRSSPEFATFLNELIHFDYIYPRLPRKLADITVQEVLSNVFVRALFLTEFLIPTWAVFGLNWNQPLKSSVAGYWLIPKFTQEKTDYVTSIIIK